MTHTSETRSSHAGLIAARLIWLLIVGTTIVLFVASLPVKTTSIQQMIESSAEFRSGIENLGLSAESYAGLVMARTIVFALIYAVVGILIFWQNEAGMEKKRTIGQSQKG